MPCRYTHCNIFICLNWVCHSYQDDLPFEKERERTTFKTNIFGNFSIYISYVRNERNEKKKNKNSQVKWKTKLLNIKGFTDHCTYIFCIISSKSGFHFYAFAINTIESQQTKTTSLRRHITCQLFVVVNDAIIIMMNVI